MKNLRKIVLIAAIALSASASGQSYRSLVSSGDKAMGSYSFEAAKRDYSRALERAQDSTERAVLQEKITWCENGIGMLQYASRPQVISSITVPRSRFFLYYSHFPDKSWRKGPDGEVFLYNDNMQKVIIPTRNQYGTYDLNYSERGADGLWGPLTDMGDGVNSIEDEIYPVLSEDGTKMYFSSKGLYGMGGYDLFVSEWDAESGQWGVAENMGFPYSSPYDDLLFCDTPDGNFSLFASNRACAADSMVIYLLKYDPTPVKKPVESVEEARMIASLKPRPHINLDVDDNTFSHSLYGDDSFAQYYSLVGRYGAVKDSLRIIKTELEESRRLYSEADGDDRKALARAIDSAESEIFTLQERLGYIGSELQAVEMEFLVRGENVSLEDVEQAEVEQAITSGDIGGDSAPQYTFIQRTLGSMPDFEFAKPAVEVDMTFRVLDESVIVEDYQLPLEGLVYQIQVAKTAAKLEASRFKGLSPVFTKKLGRGNVYRIGMFDTWAEANKALSTVKKKGFGSAQVVAFNNGSNETVKNARALEAKAKSNVKYRVAFREYPDGIPSEVRAAVSSVSTADIARTVEEGVTVYFIAPLDKSKAESVRSAAEAAGAEGVSVEPLK